MLWFLTQSPGACLPLILLLRRSWSPSRTGSMISFLFLFVLLSIGTNALPMNDSTLIERGFLDKLTGKDVVIGYRFVDQNQAAAELNRYRTLRAIPATDKEKELLEGVYLSPSLDLRPDDLPSDYWECKATANDKLLLKRPMLFISDETIKRNKEAITNYITAHGISSTDVSKTILFSEHHYSGGKTGYQMVIPPMYLEKSYYYSERKSGWGTNTLGIRVQCYQFGCPISEAPDAEWGKWPISGWPKDGKGSSNDAQHAQSSSGEAATKNSPIHS